MAKVVLNVEGMSCNHCKMAVEQAVQTLPGVTGAQVDLAAKKVDVEFDENQISEAQLKSAIVDAGYEVV